MTFADTIRGVAISGHVGIGAAVASALEARPGQVIRASRRTGLDIADPALITAFFAAQGPFDHLIITDNPLATGSTVDVDGGALMA